MGLFDLVNGFNATPDPSMAQAPTPFWQSPVGKALSATGTGLGNAYNFITNPGAAQAGPAVSPAQVAAPSAPAAPASPTPAPVAGPSVPLPQPRPGVGGAPSPFNVAPAGPPMNIAPPWATQPNPASQNFGMQSGTQQNSGLVSRFVNALRGATSPQPQTNNGQSIPQQQQQQPSIGILPRMWNDIGSIGKMFGGGGGSSPFNTTGSLY